MVDFEIITVGKRELLENPLNPNANVDVDKLSKNIRDYGFCQYPVIAENPLEEYDEKYLIIDGAHRVKSTEDDEVKAVLVKDLGEIYVELGPLRFNKARGKMTKETKAEVVQFLEEDGCIEEDEMPDYLDMSEEEVEELRDIDVTSTTPSVVKEQEMTGVKDEILIPIPFKFSEGDGEYVKSVLNRICPNRVKALVKICKWSEEEGLI